jgi:hypothetical protein
MTHARESCPKLTELVERHLADPQASWAIGTFGAIAEFHREAGEPVELCANAALTARGGIRLQINGEVQALAWERPTAGDAWTQGVALCLPAQSGTMSRRSVLTELGPDGNALRQEDRSEILFDLGLAAPHCDLCVRTADPALLAELRSAAGRAVLGTGLLATLAAASPTRVFISRLGRIEVHTPIPAPAGKTPDGPHTHLLPELLKKKRTHSANLPLPVQMVASAELYPASAIHDAHGHRSTFAAERHDAFQRVLSALGDRACLAAKARTIAAVRAGEPPRDDPTYSRAQRLTRRVALRQLAHTDGPSCVLREWQRIFDRSAS